MSLHVQNEGISVRALVDDSLLIPLQFYYVSGRGANNDPGRYPIVTHINETTLSLEYWTGTIITPFNASTIIGPYQYTLTINDSRLLASNVSFVWNQTYFSHRANCDIIAVDNISVIMSYNEYSRQVYEQFFDSGEAPGWDLVNVNITANVTECDGSHGYCLFYTGGPQISGVASRQATSPLLDLHIVSPVALSFPYNRQLPCASNEHIL